MEKVFGLLSLHGTVSITMHLHMLIFLFVQKPDLSPSLIGVPITLHLHLFMLLCFYLYRLSWHACILICVLLISDTAILQLS